LRYCFTEKHATFIKTDGMKILRWDAIDFIFCLEHELHTAL